MVQLEVRWKQLVPDFPFQVSVFLNTFVLIDLSRRKEINYFNNPNVNKRIKDNLTFLRVSHVPFEKQNNPWYEKINLISTITNLSKRGFGLILDFVLIIK